MTTPVTADAEEQALREDLAATFRLAVRHDLHEGIANHFSAMLPDGEHFLVNPFGLHFEEITASSLVVCNLDGDVVRGDGAPAASARHIHAPVHRLCPQAKVLLHTHQPWATALTMLHDGRLEWALQTSVRFYGRVAYDTDYDGIALGDEVGERMAKILGDNELLFLGNHGVMTAAPTVAQAYDDLYFLERAARTQVLAMSTGRPLAMIDPALLMRTYEQSSHERFELDYIGRHFAALRRLLDRSEPDYRDYEARAMPSLSALVAFGAASLALIVVPGPAVLYIVARSVEQGRAAGLVSVLGIEAGGLVHVGAAVIGLSALVASSAVGFSVVKYAGAAYLIVMGIRKLRERDVATEVAATVPISLGRTFVQGMVVNVLNPKTALFFLAFLPQFVDPDRGRVGLQTLVLGLLFIGIATLSDGMYAVAAASISTRVRASARFARRQRYVSGCVYLGLGATAALAGHRPTSS